MEVTNIFKSESISESNRFEIHGAKVWQPQIGYQIFYILYSYFSFIVSGSNIPTSREQASAATATQKSLSRENSDDSTVAWAMSIVTAMSIPSAS